MFKKGVIEKRWKTRNRIYLRRWKKVLMLVFLVLRMQMVLFVFSGPFTARIIL